MPVTVAKVPETPPAALTMTWAGPGNTPVPPRDRVDEAPSVTEPKVLSKRLTGVSAPAW